jgi:hypothetical protein
MPRRTKDEAEQTRDAILNAAERVFYKFGVARTSLDEIAKAANVTRGAVYWHFRDKMALCEAMMNRVFLPQEDMLENLASSESETPLNDLKKACLHSLDIMMSDRQRRRVVTIIMLRCEYVDDMAPMMKRRRECKDRMLKRCERLFRRAQKLGHLSSQWTPRIAAINFQAMMNGLIFGILEGRKDFDIAKTVPSCVQMFFRSLTTDV